jgi:hypothetical protein
MNDLDCHLMKTTDEGQTYFQLFRNTMKGNPIVVPQKMSIV